MCRIRTIIAGLLCFTISWTSVVPAYAKPPSAQAELHSKHPRVRVIHVSPKQYPAVERQLSQQGYHEAGERVALTGSADFSVSGNAAEGGAPDGCSDRTPDRSDGRASVHLTAESDDWFSGWGGSDDDAVIVFVVIGAVVLVVWTLYVFKYLYDVAAGMAPCGTWSDLSASSTWMSGKLDNSAWFGGIRFVTGFRTGGTDVGISAEAGQSEITLTEQQQSLKLQGLYWLLGPMLRWQIGGGRNPHYFQMEFVAGSTENKEVGIIAQAKAGFNFGVGDHVRWGMNFGAINMNLNENEGIITDRSQYHYLLGLELGYRF